MGAEYLPQAVEAETSEAGVVIPPVGVPKYERGFPDAALQKCLRTKPKSEEKPGR